MLILTCLLADRVPNLDGGILGQDRDATLALEVVRIHYPFSYLLVVAENTRLLEQPIHQRGLAVVDMGDNRNIS